MKRSYMISGCIALILLLTVFFTVWPTRKSVAQETGEIKPNQFLPIIDKPFPTPTPTFTPTPTPTLTPTPSPSPSPPPSPTTVPPGTMVEFRGLWVTRFDWTSYNSPARPEKIDEIVDNAAYAGFNAIFFQVRGTADAYYIPGLEPWAPRVSGGQLGQAPSPLWDPLQRMIERAHQHGIQVHAYLNVYPVWDCGSVPPAHTSPQHLYYKIRDYHGTSNGNLNGLQWYLNQGEQCASYLRATPASYFVDEHLIAVGKDLVTRYDIDGIHLDHIRYGSGAASCDPVSMYYWGNGCFSAGYKDWQRAQVNGTVARFYNDVITLKPDLMLSAAVWPIYRDYWGWGVNSGYEDYYQDSKAWVAGGYIDVISPMIYTSNYDTDTFWTQSKWYTLVADFQASAAGRWVIPGIGTGYSSFSEIATRIEMGRSLGTPGHALFSYGDLLSKGYFDDLANGPYAQPAVPPDITWHP